MVKGKDFGAGFEVSIRYAGRRKVLREWPLKVTEPSEAGMSVAGTAGKAFEIVIKKEDWMDDDEYMIAITVDGIRCPDDLGFGSMANKLVVAKDPRSYLLPRYKGSEGSKEGSDAGAEAVPSADGLLRFPSPNSSVSIVTDHEEEDGIGRIDIRIFRGRWRDMRKTAPGGTYGHPVALGYQWAFQADPRYGRPYYSFNVFYGCRDDLISAKLARELACHGRNHQVRKRTGADEQAPRVEHPADHKYVVLTDPSSSPSDDAHSSTAGEWSESESDVARVDDESDGDTLFESDGEGDGSKSGNDIDMDITTGDTGHEARKRWVGNTYDSDDNNSYTGSFINDGSSTDYDSSASGQGVGSSDDDEDDDSDSGEQSSEDEDVTSEDELM